MKIVKGDYDTRYVSNEKAPISIQLITMLMVIPQ